jgi:hypothetical protein
VTGLQSLAVGGAASRRRPALQQAFGRQPRVLSA